MKTLFKYLFLFCIGGGIYCLIELAFRGHTHPSMFAVGGICFIICGCLNEIIPWDMTIQMQMLICAATITAIEFVAGLILNVWLGLNIWDYSRMPLNIMGQICLPFTVAWFFLSAAGIILDDYLRYWFFHEERPRYTLRRRKC